MAAESKYQSDLKKKSKTCFQVVSFSKDAVNKYRGSQI